MNLIIISDLHLSAGLNEETRKYSRNEDFFFDNEFDDFLKYHQRENPGNNHLIINGDLFDFLQVNGPLTQELKRTGGATFSISDREEKYGLGTESEKTCWKLDRIVNGHKVFFKALARFLSEENRLSIISGNHDIELHWPDVQTALIDHIAGFVSDEAIPSKIEARVTFYPWFYYNKNRKTYVEHGSQYDPFNSFEYLLWPVYAKDTDRLWLPFGSFFVRYFFNKLEYRNPFADNIKPAIDYMNWAFKKDKPQFIRSIFKHFSAALGIYLKAGDFSKDEKETIGRRNDEKLSIEATKAGLKPEVVTKIYDQRAAPFTRSKLSVTLYYSGTLLVIAAIILALGIGFLWYTYGVSPTTFIIPLGLLMIRVLQGIWTKNRKQVDLKPILSTIKEQLEDVEVIVFGHTHDPKIEKVPGNCWHFNIGTWTTVFSEEERLIREAKQFGFVWIRQVDGKQHANLYQWNRNLRKPEKLMLLEPEDKALERS
ncbi:hypothetical protein D3OALGA1CA_170 [Olavius algarvensis associated proteobacterium Delta 3]|nr:hypothetical protein D3OALGA1CA_170 [Olavius algarvensis associated proteobacterium Delta 3]